MDTPYTPRRPAASRFITVRSLRTHCMAWGEASLVKPERPPLVMLHGWMDVGASFQFVVDALAALEGERRYVIAPDWRGFGRSAAPAGCDSFWFPDYLGDLDALLDALAPTQAVDLVGHSMGGNVVMSYAGVRPARVRRLVNLEGFGLPESQPQQAPQRLAQWLDQLKAPVTLRPYASLQAVAARLLRNNPRLSADKAAWLAAHWSQCDERDGHWHLMGDPAHKRVNPMLYRAQEVLETWKLITAPLLWMEGDRTEIFQHWNGRYSRSEFETRLAVVPQVESATLAHSGHMLHHDQPEALAARLLAFLDP